MAENKQKNKEVFISYCRANKDLAQYFCNLLEGNGIGCWIDYRDIPSGKNWAENIVSALKECELVAFLVSQASVKSEEVAKEIGLANSPELKKEIFQIRLEDAPLSPAMLYHLSNKQWIDALEAEKSIRFNAALTAILKHLKKEESVIVDGKVNNVINQSRRLVEELKKNFGKDLESLNTMISLKEIANNSVRITFPLRFGATGLDLIFEFIEDKGKYFIEFYANAAQQGDRLQYIFWNNFLKEDSEIASLFPSKEWNQANRWRCLHLHPKTEIPSPVIPAVEAHSIFTSHMHVMSEKIFPPLIEWGLYVKSVTDAIYKLQEKLKEYFPENEGWRVGAREGEHLADCRVYGAINVYKDYWTPKTNNYQGRGWLSIRLSSEDHFIKNLSIGIVKYEEWHDLGTWEDTLFNKGKELLGEGVKKSGWWPFYQSLSSPWDNSGISQAEYNWKDRLDDFINYCLEKFSALKELVNDLDTACSEIPGLQDKNPAELNHDNWSHDHLYIRNRQRLMAEGLGKLINDNSVMVDYLYRGSGHEKKIFFIIKEEQFEVAVAFLFHSTEIKTEICNLEPPDFETAVARQFLEQNFKETIVLLDKKVSADKPFNGKTLAEWLDDVETYINERAAGCISALMGLKSHLKNIVALTEEVRKTIVEVLPESEDWRVDNKARKLLPQESIDIYHDSWKLVPDQIFPPLMLQIKPDSACFDRLSIVLKEFGQSRPEMERLAGAISGACDIAFGAGDDNPAGLWSRKFDDAYHITGGSSFENSLIAGDEQEALLTYLKEICAKLKMVKPLIDRFCNQQNALEKKDLIAGFWNELSERIKTLYSSEKWNISCDHNNKGSLFLSSRDWKSRFKIGFGEFTDSTWIGVWGDCNNDVIRENYQKIAGELKNADKRMSNDKHGWTGYFYTKKSFTNNVDMTLLVQGSHKVIIDDYLKMLDEVVKASEPVIEEFLNTSRKPVTSTDGAGESVDDAKEDEK